MSHLTVPVSEEDHCLGPFSAPLTLVEYGDYQCHLCCLFQPLIKQLKAYFGSDLKIIFRHFPLKKSHPFAFDAACAAQAASLQHKFWEMHALLYQHAHRLDEEALLENAKKLQLDVEKFQKDRASTPIHEKIEEEFMQGVLSGVNGVPCFFIQGKRYDGDPGYDSLVQALSHSLN